MDTDLDTDLDTTQKSGQKTIQKTIQKKTKLQLDTIKYLKETPHAIQKEMAENISGATLEGIKYNLIRLQKNGAIRRIGSDRDGFWEVIE